MSERKPSDWNYLGRPLPLRGPILKIRDLRTNEEEAELNLRNFERRVGNGTWDGIERRGV